VLTPQNRGAISAPVITTPNWSVKLSANAQVLVTGWNGFLGSYLCNALSSNGDLVVRCGRVAESDVRCDLAETAPVLPRNISTAVHAAGVAHKTTQSQTDRDLFQKGNVQGVANLLSALENTDVTSFVLISSVSVYGLMEGENITENHSTKPHNEYGKSKLDAENLVLQWAEKHDINCTIVRLPLIVGNSAPGNLKQLISSIKARRFVLPGGGKARKSMVLADDIATWVARNKDGRGTYNLTDREDPSYFELCNAITTHHNLSAIPAVPEFLMNTAGRIGDLGSRLLNKPLPYNSAVHHQLTKSLTFSSERAIQTGWKPSSVVANTHRWLD